MRRGGQGVRTIAAEVERGTQCEPPGIDLSVPSPLSAYAERGTGGEDQTEGDRGEDTAANIEVPSRAGTGTSRRFTGSTASRNSSIVTIPSIGCEPRSPNTTIVGCARSRILILIHAIG